MVTAARRWAAAAVVPAALAVAAPAYAAPAATESVVVARGLENVRGVIVDRHGTLYVAEAGRGGAGPCIPANFGPELCFGSTGAVTEVRRGVQRRIVTGLPSLRGRAAEGEPASSYGPHDVALNRDGSLLVALGYATDPAHRPQLGTAGAALGTVIKVGRGGSWSVVADLAAHEQANNPDGQGLESQPFGLATDNCGGFAVADAAANAAVRFDAREGLSTLAALPTTRHEAPPEWGLPPGTTVPVQPVPVAITRGPDGAFYVGELTGAFFPEGAAKVWRVVPGQPATVYASGFTTIIDVTFDARGRLVVLEMAKHGLDSEDLTGALIRVEPDGRHTELASAGLVAPTSVAAGPGGVFYVANQGLSETGGEVVRLRPRL